MPKNIPSTPATAQAGWKINDWCRAIPCSRGSFYNLLERDADLIQIVKLGRGTIVLTPPIDYLRAKAAEQAQFGAPKATVGANVQAAAPHNNGTGKRGRGRPRKGEAPPPKVPGRGRGRPPRTAAGEPARQAPAMAAHYSVDQA